MKAKRARVRTSGSSEWDNDDYSVSSGAASYVGDDSNTVTIDDYDDWETENGSSSANGNGGPVDDVYVDCDDGYVMINDDDDDDVHYSASASAPTSGKKRPTGVGSRGPYKKKDKNVRGR